MSSLPIDAPRKSFTYTAFGAQRAASLCLPADTDQRVRGTVVLCTGSAMLALDPAHSAVAGLELLATELQEAILEASFGVIRPEPISGNPSSELLLDAAESLLEAAFDAGGPYGHRIIIALSAAAPLLAIAAAQRKLDAMVLVAPPILEEYSNRPDRVELPLVEHLGLSPEVAAGLGALKPMSKSTQVAPRALLVHGASDSIVTAGDSIGWRASLAAAGITARRIEIAFAEHDLSPGPCRAAAISAIVRFVAEQA